MSEQALVTRQVRDVDISKCLIVSNNQKNKSDIANNITDVYYWESILQETMRASVVYVDTGNAVQTDGKFKTLIDGLPLNGQEKTTLVLKDANEVELNLTLYVNMIKPVKQDTVKSLVTLDLVSKEFILNEKVRLNRRFDGKISDHIDKILKDSKFFGSKKKLDIEETANTYNFIGNNKKPLFTCLWLAKKAVPTGIVPGNSAGFFFYETSKGFNFKSIDTLLSKEKNNPNYKSFIFTQTQDGAGETVPIGYNKILEHKIKDVSGDIQSKLQIGTYTTRTILFDPVNCYYEVINPRSQDTEKNISKAGKDLPMLNPEFNREGLNQDFTRTQYHIIDKGSLPSGTVQQQIMKSNEPNFDPKNILSQSTMRYNQMFSSRVSITIVADFSLHAGDLVFVDSAQLSVSEVDKSLNDKFGGYYVIADLCHYISTANGGYTKLLLVRDSLGKKGSPTYKAI